MTADVPICPRCGRRVQLTLPEAAGLAVRNEIEMDRMRLVFPDRLKLGIRTLAKALPCLAGTCTTTERVL